jgi:hypothetical protein
MTEGKARIRVASAGGLAGGGQDRWGCRFEGVVAHCPLDRAERGAQSACGQKLPADSVMTAASSAAGAAAGSNMVVTGR